MSFSDLSVTPEWQTHFSDNSVCHFIELSSSEIKKKLSLNYALKNSHTIFKHIVILIFAG